MFTIRGGLKAFQLSEERFLFVNGVTVELAPCARSSKNRDVYIRTHIFMPHQWQIMPANKL